MPNWCDNAVTISHEDKSKIDAIEAGLAKEEKEFFNVIRPRPASEEDNWYGWNVNEWGTKWEASVHDWNREDDNTIWVSFDSAWSPPTALYGFMHDEDGYDVRAYYHEGGMSFCGRFEDGYDDYYEYDIGDISNIPEDIADYADLEYRHDEWIDEQQEEKLSQLDRTEWFDKKVKPEYEGRYEIETIEWPWPQYCNWDGEKWSRWEGDDIKVTKWRGLIEEYQEEVAE